MDPSELISQDEKRHIARKETIVSIEENKEWGEVSLMFDRRIVTATPYPPSIPSIPATAATATIAALALALALALTLANATVRHAP